MTKDTSSHFLLGYGNKAVTPPSSEYTQAFRGLYALPRTAPVLVRSEIDISQTTDDHLQPITISTSREAFREIPIQSSPQRMHGLNRSESHFATSYSDVPFPRTEYHEKFKVQRGSPKPSLVRTDRPTGNIFPVECDTLDYISETKRAYVYDPSSSSERPCPASSSNLRESHFTLGSSTATCTPESTSHSHYAKRAGLRGSSQQDPEILSLRDELSKSHFSLCD